MSGAAKVADANGLVAEIGYLLDSRFNHEEENELVLGHHEKLYRNPSYGGGHGLGYRYGIVQISRAESVHGHGQRYSDVLRRQAVLREKPFLFRDNRGQKSGGGRRYTDANFVLCVSFINSRRANSSKTKNHENIQ